MLQEPMLAQAEGSGRCPSGVRRFFEKGQMRANLSLIEGDCMAGLRGMGDNSFSLAICDPPYGGNDAIGMKDCKRQSAQATARNHYKEFENVTPPRVYFDEIRRVSKRQIMWGCNFFDGMGLGGGRIVWDKKGTAFGRAEMASYSNSKSVQIFEYAWNGMIQGDMKHKEVRIHSTQKPVALYKWLLANYAHPGDTILDSHLGSMSIAVACWDMGFDLTGYELDHDYYTAGVERVEKHKSQGQFEF